MSVNRKGGNAIVGLLLAHGEKLVIAVVLGLVGWLLYGSTSFEVVDKKPGELASLAQDARSHFQNDFGWDNALNEEDGARLSEDFKPLASVQVAATNYAVATQGWNPAVVPPIVLREDPPLLPAIGLIVSAGTELMGFEGDLEYQRGIALEELRKEREKQRKQEEERKRQEKEEGGGRSFDVAEDDKDRKQIQSGSRTGGVSPDEDDRREIISYVTLLAKVPVKDQTDAYWQAFENALGFDQSNDQPVYLGYLVERRELNAGKPGEWQKVFLRNGYDDARLGGVDSGTLIKSTADWLEDLEEIADQDYTDDVLTFPLPPLVGRSWGPEVVHPDVRLQVEVEIDEQNEDRLDRGRNFDREQGGFLDGGFVEEEEFDREDDGIERVYETDFVMLRFFDMTVKPGRLYQYRVQLVVEDPNDGVSRSYLAKEALARLDADGKKQKDREFRFRQTEWSAPSAPVSVPQAGGVLLASTKQSSAGAFNAEPSVTLMVDAFDTQAGELVEAAEKKTFQRGGVANYDGKDVWYMESPRWLARAEKFSFRTDVTILDIYGGQKLGRDDTSPSEILVMDSSGGLSVRSELIDERDVKQTEARYSGEDDPYPGGRGGGGGGEFGEFFGEF